MLDGTKLFVSDAHVADWIIVVAKTNEGISLFLVEGKATGLAITQLDTIAKDKQCEVVFEKVKVGKEALIGEPGKGWSEVDRVLQRAAVAKCCEMVGGAQKVLEMTVDYAKERVQFSQPIGSFQAVQHHCSNMFIAVEGSKWLAYRTAWLVSNGFSHLKECYMAKAWISDAYQRVVRLGLQVHGGMGLMKDYELQFYFREAKGTEVALGDADFYREKVACQLLDS